jgi:hypothetical protein
VCAACVGEKISVYKILVRTPKGKRTLTTLGCSWKARIGKYLKKPDWMMCTGYIWLIVGTSGKLS